VSALAIASDPPPESTLVGVGDKDRRTYIGGSDIAALLGLDPYGKTPLTVYLAKIGEAQGIMDPEKKRFLERRKRWEPVVVQMLREEFDGEIVSVNERYVDQDHDFLAAEIDFEWRDTDGSVQNGEIKTVSPFAFNERGGWGEAGTDQVPIHYFAQNQWGLGIKRRRTCIVAAMAGLDTMVFYRVDRDDQAIADMRDVAVAFWRDHVLAKLPPAPLTMGDCLTLFKKHRGRPVDLDEEHAEAVANLRAVRSNIDALKGDQAELELKVAKYVCAAWSVPLELREKSDGSAVPTIHEDIKDNAALIHDGRVLCTWAAGKGAHLDQKRLGLDHPEIKREYMVSHHYRNFRFPKS
jgi:predicted phage-related endonuclease